MNSFKQFIKKLSDKKWIAEQDKKKQMMHDQLKKEWVQEAKQNDEFMDKIIFEYSKIFNVEEQTPLSSPDQLDILIAAGVSLATLVQRQNKEYNLQEG